MKVWVRRLATPALLLSLVLLAVVLGDFRGILGLVAGQAQIEPEALNGEYVAEAIQGEYLGQAVASTKLPEFPLPILGARDLPKRIEVDLTNQRVYAFEGDQKVYDFLISSGKWGRTPTGTFRIWGKFKYTKMSGGSRALRTYYYLPNVPYVMFFSNDEISAGRGFSLHGTYWHDNFGHPMSHGCVNMRTEEAKLLFYWTEPGVNSENFTRAGEDSPGTEIVIYGTAPRT